MPKININQLNVSSKTDLFPENDEISEKGPWTAEIWDVNGGRKIVLQSADFTHDVTLYVSGDFCDIDHKLQYAKLLADRMNRMPEE